MQKKIFLFIFLTVLIPSILISCSSKDSKKILKTKPSNIQKPDINNFQSEVEKACNKIELSVFDNYKKTNINDTKEINTNFAMVEDELDGLISRFGEITPSEKDIDSWEIIVDDLSHARDIFPNFIEHYQQAIAISDAGANVNDPEQIKLYNDQISKIQTKINNLHSDLTQTFDEYISISKKLGIKYCFENF
ncbi:MAG: hypothetical protein KBF89_04025 [Acidimicrobiia bacterium]|nr:hypothetical protein [Acidimicrobiia bacterium]